jgi:hypothetical protein
MRKTLKHRKIATPGIVNINIHPPRRHKKDNACSPWDLYIQWKRKRAQKLLFTAEEILLKRIKKLSSGSWLILWVTVSFASSALDCLRNRFFSFSVFRFPHFSREQKRETETPFIYGKGFGAEASFLRKSSSTFYFGGRIEFFFSDSLNHVVIICRSQNI